MPLSKSQHAIITYTMLNGNESEGVTQKEIADATEISPSTVSRTINNVPGFGKSTKPYYVQGYYYDPTLLDSLLARSGEIEPIRRPEKSQPTIPERPSDSKLPLTSPPVADRLEKVSDTDLKSDILKALIPLLANYAESDITRDQHKQLAQWCYNIGITLARRLPEEP